MNPAEEDTRILMIGAVLGDDDQDSMDWSADINTLSRECSAATADLTSPLRLNVIYFVDGKIRSNKFEGVRTGRHFRSKNLLVIQAAISKTADGPRRSLLLERLTSALAEAEVFAVKRKIAVDLSVIRDAISPLVNT